MLFMMFHITFRVLRLILLLVADFVSREGGGEGHSGFQVTGMIEGFWGFEIFDSGIFLGTKIWQVFFRVA